MSTTRILAIASRLALAAVFAAAGIGKLFGQHGQLVMPLLLSPDDRWLDAATRLEAAVPLIELVVAAALLSGIGIRAASCVSGLLSAGFLWVALGLPEGVRCGCFGILGGIASRPVHVLMAVVMLAASALVLVARRRPARRLPIVAGQPALGA